MAPVNVMSGEQWSMDLTGDKLADTNRTEVSAEQRFAETFDVWDPLE